VERLIAQRKSILDTVKSDFSALKPRLGAEDRQRLSAHLESIRDLELRLTTAPPETCVHNAVTGEDLAAFGNPAYCTGPLAQLA